MIKWPGGGFLRITTPPFFLWPNHPFWWLEITHNSAWSLPFPLPFVELVAFKDSETVTKKASEGWRLHYLHETSWNNMIIGCIFSNQWRSSKHALNILKPTTISSDLALAAAFPAFAAGTTALAAALAGTAFGGAATDTALAGTALALALGAALGVAAAAGLFEACQTPICWACAVCCSRASLFNLYEDFAIHIWTSTNRKLLMVFSRFCPSISLVSETSEKSLINWPHLCCCAHGLPPSSWAAVR